MGSMYSVKCKNAGKLSFVGGWEDTEGGHRMGLSVFSEGEYLLNFVLLSEEEEILKGFQNYKAVKDIGFIFMADPCSFMVLKYRDCLPNPKESYFLERVKGGDKEIMSYFSVTYYSEEPNLFTEAIRLAITNPVKGNNLYSSIPEDIEEVVL